jgi:hypothetical protein
VVQFEIAFIKKKLSIWTVLTKQTLRIVWANRNTPKMDNCELTATRQQPNNRQKSNSSRYMILLPTQEMQSYSQNLRNFYRNKILNTIFMHNKYSSDILLGGAMSSQNKILIDKQTRECAGVYLQILAHTTDLLRTQRKYYLLFPLLQ